MNLSKSLTNARIVVAGGAGFVGSHLVDRLVLTGAVVTVVDNLSTGSRGNIDAHLRSDRIKFVSADVCDLPDIEADIFVNLACPASPRIYQADPISTWRTSVIGGINLAAMAQRQGARLVHFSTSEVYGDPLEHPQSETYWGNVNPNGVRACYDEGKRALEALLMDYKRQYDLDVRILRVFNTYGPRMKEDDGRAIPTFVRQALSGQPMSVEGNGLQTRSFCYVSDLVDGVMAVMATDAARGEVINLGNPGEVSILELCDLIASLIPNANGTTLVAAAKDDPSRRCPDISKAQALLNWTPQVSLEEGLKSLLATMDRTSEQSCT